MSEKLQFNVSGFGTGRPIAKFGRSSKATYKGEAVRVIDRKWTGSTYLYAVTTPENINELPDQVVTGVKEDDLS